MPITVIITRDVEDRYRGFLSSVMLEIAIGVYTSPRLTKAVRERIWSVVSDWPARIAGHDLARRRSAQWPGPSNSWGARTQSGGNRWRIACQAGI